MKSYALLLMSLLLFGCATHDPVLEKQASDAAQAIRCYDGSEVAMIEHCPVEPLDGCMMCPDTTCLDSITHDPKDAGICTPINIYETVTCPDGREIGWPHDCQLDETAE